MLFNSYIFVLFFLPLALLGYYGLNHLKKYQTAKIFLIGMSLWFYAYFNYSYLFIILISITVNYMVSSLVCKEKLKRCIRKAILVIGVVFDICIIFYYKYFNFLLNNVNSFLQEDFVIKEIVMPLGISFFTFQQISYLVDSRRGETKNYGVIDYVLFVSFFPQLIAGPIVFHDEIIPQFNSPEKKKLNHDMLAKGIWLFAIGLFKKVMIADTLGRGADYGFTNIVSLSGLEAVLVMFCYSLQIYFDFSGYCDMASGIGNMFQVEFPLNFDSPYKSLSITEFWTRWHITLTRFLRKYVYIPLGGSKNGNGRTLVNIMIVYLISGIWHGAAWTFVLWGVMHGIARVLERMIGNIVEKIPSLMRWAFTFLFVNLTWILFRAETVDDAFGFYERLLCGWSSGVQGILFAQFELLEFTYVVEHVGVLRDYVSQFPWIYMMIVLVVSMMIVLFPKNCHEREFKLTYKRVIGTVIMLVWSILSFSGISTFLYFNF